MKGLLIQLAAMLLLGIVGFGVGVHWQSGHDANALATSRADTQACVNSAEASQSALDTLAQQSADRLQQLQHLRDAMSMALDQRDAAQARIAQLTSARSRDIKQAAHVSSDCQPLVDLPVCPAVARRLWGQVAGADTTADYQGAR
jgi:hypothetical protein